MRVTNSLLLGAATLFVAGAAPGAAAAASLSGQVSSAKEGAMEGVLVSAKRDGSTVTTTVVSDASGRFSFPAAVPTNAHSAANGSSGSASGLLLRSMRQPRSNFCDRDTAQPTSRLPIHF